MSTLTQSLLSFSRFCKFHGCDLVPPSFSGPATLAPSYVHTPQSPSQQWNRQALQLGNTSRSEQTDRQTDSRTTQLATDDRFLLLLIDFAAERTDGRAQICMQHAELKDGWNAASAVDDASLLLRQMRRVVSRKHHITLLAGWSTLEAGVHMAGIPMGPVWIPGKCELWVDDGNGNKKGNHVVGNKREWELFFL